MKKILGLDLGSASIGWALINEKEENNKTTSSIIALGSRIIPYEGTEGKDFAKGTGESRNSLRTQARTTRKGYDRYQLRRKYLVDILIKNNMMPTDELKNLPKMELWALRAKAVTQEISLQELGRLLLWLNQKRGYKSSRSDANKDKKDTAYVAEVKSRHEIIKEQNITIGQYFYNELVKDNFYKVKENIFPREAYIEEFDAIWKCQERFHQVLNNCPSETLARFGKSMFPSTNQEHLRNEIIKMGLYNLIKNFIIYNQRPLKSQKGLVSVCEFEGFTVKKGEKEYFVGPKVAPKSSPLFQIVKIWENINNIKINKRKGEEIIITHEQKKAIFEHLDNNEKLTPTDLIKILGLKKDDCYINKQLAKGLNGNVTKNAIKQYLGKDYDKLLKFELHTITEEREVYLYSKKTGEVLNSKPKIYIDSNVEKEPLYQLWHTIYSISDQEECSNALQTKFKIDTDTANKLASIDFTKHAFGNKSAKVIRKILPYLMEGDGYSEAMCYAGYDHSNSLTNEQNLDRKLLDSLKPIAKNSLRQPIVEKILNQMVNVVNAIIEKYGKPDEIRIELARELKQSKEERNDADKSMSKRQRENETIIKRLEEYGLRATRNNIIKWRLYEEIDNEDKKLNAMCIYCGQPISLTQAIQGTDVDIEHIIPKSKLFDDSQSNKTLAHRHCNRNKNDMTAFDFMKSKSPEAIQEYIERVNLLYSNHIINKAKRDKLLMTESKIPDNFIDRQLRESQYIAKKAREILQTICHSVWTTSGTVTSELRHLWGWDDVTMNLQFPKYKAIPEMTEIKEWESDHGKNKHKKEVIKDWSKRDDHRHHAVDALTIACTKQGFIQRFNTLSSNKTREDMSHIVDECSVEYKEKMSLLEKYIVSQQPISVSEVQKAVGNILISFKSGKKVAVPGTRKIGKRGNKRVVQTGIIVPRGSLHEDGVYGSIKQYQKDSNANEVRFTNNIVKKYKLGIGAQGFVFTGKETYEVKEKLNKKTNIIESVTTDKIKNTLDSIVDKGIRNAVLKRLNRGFEKDKTYKDDVKKALENLKNLDKDPIYLNEEKKIPIKTVRCFTGLSAVVPVKKDEQGNDIGFVKPGNNHHIAIYIDKDGNKQEYVCTFWHAVERKKYGIPVIINNTNEVWDKILLQADGTYPNSFLEKLPKPNLSLELSMQQNQMFILGMNKEEIELSISNNDYKAISDKLYRVQKMSIIPSSGQLDLTFRHHLETQLSDDNNSKICKRFIKAQSLNSLFNLQPYKVSIDCLGNIVDVKEK